MFSAGLEQNTRRNGVFGLSGTALPYHLGTALTRLGTALTRLGTALTIFGTALPRLSQSSLPPILYGLAVPLWYGPYIDAA